MNMNFDADEVLEMAEQIERNAAKFYRQAAVKTSSPQVKEMFLRMAVMEDGHLQTFVDMRRDLSEREKGGMVFDPYDEAALYLQAMADSKGFEGMKSLTEELTGNESVREVLEIAIDAEKNSVLYYVGIKNLVPVDAGRDKVEAVIREEVGHVAQLRQQLNAIGG